MPSLIYSDSVEIKSIFEGGLILLPPISLTEELCGYATKIIQDVFECHIAEIKTDDTTSLTEFIQKAKKCKSTFTNDVEVHRILKALILRRYQHYPQKELVFDVPRLRIVPNSNFLSAGISYNYKPHRDTWYGAGQDQINHWISLANVTEQSSFYIAPSYFFNPIENNSEIFDLDEWDSKYRPAAENNTVTENRPHPIPLTALSVDERYNIVIPSGSEIVFSGHHLHGSAANTTASVRFSIDYRVCLLSAKYKLPNNIDSRATGNYKKFMLPV
jgi:hypothetical protein